MYEPVAYDKRIVKTEDGDYQPIIRIDDLEIELPVQKELHRAQQVLECFQPDVWEGTEIEWSFNCFPDARCMNA